MKAILDALNVVYEEREKRGFIKLNLVSLCFTLGAIASLLLAVSAVVVMPIALSFLGLHAVTDLLIHLSRWPILVVLIILGLAVLYRFGPSRRKPRWQWITVGSVVAAIAWLAASILLSWYLSHFANYDATYGSLGAGIGLMLWMWISSIVILFGAELNFRNRAPDGARFHGRTRDNPLAPAERLWRTPSAKPVLTIFDASATLQSGCGGPSALLAWSIRSNKEPSSGGNPHGTSNRPASCLPNSSCTMRKLSLDGGSMVLRVSSWQSERCIAAAVPTKPKCLFFAPPTVHKLHAL